MTSLPIGVVSEINGRRIIGTDYFNEMNLPKNHIGSRMMVESIV